MRKRSPVQSDPTLTTPSREILDELRQMAVRRGEHTRQMQILAKEYDRVSAQQPYWALGGLLVGAVIGISFLLG
jgi:hypothetical protein